MVHRFIQEAGNTTQAMGLGRIVGQIYAYLFFSAAPRSLSDMQQALGISKGAASMSVRQLEQWEAVEKIWVRGDRRDFYRANDWLGKVLRNVFADLAKRRLTQYDTLFGEIEQRLTDADGDGAFLRERVAHLRRFYGRTRKAWDNPIIRALLQ